MKDAKCRGAAPSNGEKTKDSFFPERGGTAEKAIVNFCFKCDVRDECNDYADRIGAKVGVWGGKRRVREEAE